jgi:hypothetical protein
MGPYIFGANGLVLQFSIVSKVTSWDKYVVLKTRLPAGRSGVWILVAFFPHQYRGADKSLARPGRKQAKATKL